MKRRTSGAPGMEDGQLVRELHTFFLYAILFLVSEVLASMIMEAFIK